MQLLFAYENQKNFKLKEIEQLRCSGLRDILKSVAHEVKAAEEFKTKLDEKVNTSAETNVVKME